MHRLLESSLRNRGLVVGLLWLAATSECFGQGDLLKGLWAGKKEKVVGVDVQARIDEFTRLVTSAREASAAGKFADAVRDFKAGLAIVIELTGRDNKRLIPLWSELGSIAEGAGDWAVAEEARREAVEIASFVHGEKDWRATDTRRALDDLLRRKKLSADDRAALVEASRQSNDAVRLHNEGKYGEAREAAESATKTQSRILGEDHPDFAKSLGDVARALDAQREIAAAETHYKRALAIREKALGPDHPDVALALNNLAELYREQRNYAAAEPLHKRALEIHEKTVGPDHPLTATSLNNLGLFYYKQMKFAEAEPLIKQALAIHEKTLGPDHPSTAQSLTNLGSLCFDKEDYAAAEPLFQRALAIREKTLGPDHPDFATSLHNLALTFVAQENYAAAEPLYNRTLAVREKVLGPDHPDFAVTLSKLAELYCEQGEDAKAEPLRKRAAAIEEKAPGPAPVSPRP
ncbi:MAG: tetratricopeptide repeat protein [Planctomycetia bacterium]